MQTTKQKNNRVAVARSLRELEILFGKKLSDTKENTLREQGGVVKLLTKQLTQEIPK